MTNLQEEFRAARQRRGLSLDYNSWVEKRGYRLYHNIIDGVNLLHISGPNGAKASTERATHADTLDAVDRLLGMVG